MHSGHEAEPQNLRCLYSEENWLDVQGFTNFTAAHFVAKFPGMNSWLKSIFSTCSCDITLSGKSDLKTDSFPVFENYRLFTTDWESSHRTAFALPIRISISLLRIPPLVNTTPRWLKLSSCYSVLPLTCSVHWLGFLEKHDSSVFFYLFSFPFGHTELQTNQENVGNCSDDATSSTKSSVRKANRWPCSFQQ